MKLRKPITKVVKSPKKKVLWAPIKGINVMVDWSAAKEGIVAEVLRDSETFLTGTVTLATSADQRAAVVAGTFATAGAAIDVGATVIAVANATGFGAGQTITVDSGASQETAIVVSASGGRAGARITLAAPLTRAQRPANSSLDETDGKFSSLQSIEKSQNVEIIAPSRTAFASRESAS